MSFLRGNRRATQIMGLAVTQIVRLLVVGKL
jgi:hypothetical protein